MELNFVEVEKLIGRESGVIMALDKVSKSDIRHFCELIDDDNTPFNKINWEGKAAPPAMLMVWTMPPLWSPEPTESIEPHELAFKVLDKAGYDSAIGISLEQEFFQPVKIGDQLSYKVKLTDISHEEIETKMGNGYQVDLVYTISNQNGEIVSTSNYSLLKFKILNPVV